MGALAKVIPLSPDSGTYTNKELFEAIRETEKDMHGGFARVEAMIHPMNDRLLRVETVVVEMLVAQVKDHEARLRTLQMAVFVFAPLILTALSIFITVTR